MNAMDGYGCHGVLPESGAFHAPHDRKLRAKPARLAETAPRRSNAWRAWFEASL